MDKHQAQIIIEATFENPFDKIRFTGFSKNLLNQIEDAPFTFQGNFIPDAYKPFIGRYIRIGKYDDGENRIDILIVYLNKETSIERARTMQRNFVAGYLNGKYGSDTIKDAAMVAFVSPNEEDWRFSLVKMDYRFEPGKDGKYKVKEEFTPAKRWSFLVGKNESSHTAQSRLVPILADDQHNPDLARLEEAFNIEKVTKEFFEKYRELFLWTKETLDKIVDRDSKIKADFETKGVNTVDFSKKLMGQIVFLYFLQKKGWFGVPRDAEWGTGSKIFLRELFEGMRGKYVNFFNDILEPLFYEALRIDRRHDDDYYKYFNCKIPFLNGGLFDPINNYDWVHTDILLPNELFSNKNITREGDKGNGILDIFDRFNFTVKEDEPLEKEVAIDPEMLGKVFENLLEVKDRKSKGTYYTPREIVHYMCQQSLIQYLTTELEGKVKKEAIEFLILEGEKYIEHLRTAKEKKEENEDYQGYYIENEYFIELKKHANEIDDSLSKIKVCDPAVGSGAFPVGMMTEIVKARMFFVETNCLEKIFINSHQEEVKRNPYNFKRDCIEHSLYGVDIDPGAVEIAKLRLWLSLVVDEEDIKQIKPLPNLDYKIVCGNSLLCFPDGLVVNVEISKEIEQFKMNYFSETNPSEKTKIRDDIKKKFKELIECAKEYANDIHKINFDFHIYFSEVFHEKKGFDVVIANPPYVKEYVNRKAFDGLRNSPYYKGKMDIWYFFACIGIDLLKEFGNLTFIAQNNWVTSYGASKMRNKVISDTTILKLLDFGDYKIFETAGIQTMVMMLQRDKKSDNYIFDYRRVIGKKAYFEDILDLLNYKTNTVNQYLTPKINRNRYSNETLTFNASVIEDVIGLIEKTLIELKQQA